MHKEAVRLREKTLRFVEDMRVKEGPYGRYRLNPSSREDILYASTFAALVRELHNDLSNLKREERQQWIDYINSTQDEKSGFFLDSKMKNEDLTSQIHDREHINMHLCCHCLSALKALGGKPRYPLRFALKYRDPDVLIKWLESRDWTNPWLEGNSVMFIGEFLVVDWETTKSPQAKKAIEIYFDWLDSFQDPETGYWGRRYGADDFTAMCGAFHEYLIYYYLNRPINYMERIVDTTLSLQHQDGLFNPEGGGGSCQDLDAVSILVNMYQRIDYRQTDIERALRKALSGVLKMQNKDGGFVFTRGKDFNLMGWKKSCAPADESELFSTWFRTYAIALISQILKDIPYAENNFKFNEHVGMGWHK